MASDMILFSLMHDTVYTHLFIFLYAVIDNKLMGCDTEMIFCHSVSIILCYLKSSKSYVNFCNRTRLTFNINTINYANCKKIYNFHFN